MSHKMKSLSPEEQEAIFSNYLISSWSYSKVQTFTRNQKCFEMETIFGLRGKRGPSSIAGNGYHQALAFFFARLQEGEMIELPAMEMAAFEEIETIPANQWKLGKTTPTMEKAVQKALEDVNKLLRNFYSEKGVYLDELEEILGVEQYFDEFLTVNGVDIPLPCHGLIDLAFRTKSGKTVILDHKSKSSYTGDGEAAMVIGQQAITYTLGFEAAFGIHVDEVWFVENKASQNSDKTAQVKPIVTSMDENARRLYEMLLYEGLREMLGAVQDPDHVYTINTADKFVDMEEVFDFWTRTQICEVDDFNVDENKKPLIAKRLQKIRNSNTQMINPQIIKKFREKILAFTPYDLSSTNMTQQEKIEHVYRTNSIVTRVAHTFEGYSSNTFLLEVSAGTKIGGLYNYRLDIANALDVPMVRMPKQLVVHNERAYFSIEMAKKRDKILPFNPDDLQGKKIPLGKDNFGNIIFWNLENPVTPHALFCGTSGSGKTEILKNLVHYAKLAGFTQIVVFDTKYVFNKMADESVMVLNEISAIEQTAEMLVKHMNKLVQQDKVEWTLVIFDEFADAYDQARAGNELKIYEEVAVGEFANGRTKYQRQCTGATKSLQENIRMLLQKGRSCGIRVAAATQRASSKIIDGDAKVNFPVQVCLKVPKEVDSKVVLDESGAESLQGNGDALIKSPEYPDVVRFQAYYKSQNVTA